MHPVTKRESVALAILIAALIPLYVLLPLAGRGTYASPDETANAVVIRQLSWYGTISLEEPLANEFPWLHPRSFISRGETIVPVGFIGWPWIISVFSTFLGQGVVPFLAVAVFLSSFVPLFLLLRVFGFRAALLGVAVAATYPAMIVFGNRALFPQIAVVAFAIWSTYLLSRMRSDHPPFVFALLGALVALAFAARPTEAMWLAPWLAWAARSLRPDRKRVLAACAGALIPLAFLAFHAQASYGGFWKSGYVLSGNPSLANDVSVGTITVPADGTRSWMFPFGIHPRHVIWNVRSFLLGPLLPWTLLAGVALTLVARDVVPSARRDWKRFVDRYAVALLGVWTVAALVAYYGQGLYTDHVQIGAVTIANSFIRYLLPLGPILGLAFAYAYAKLERVRQGSVAGVALALMLCLAGGYAALLRDDEGILTTRRELVRYREIARAANEHFGPKDVIISERSDKIFFPSHRAASPLPEVGEVARLAKARPDLKIGLFARPLSQSQSDAWRKAGLEPVELLVSGREKLYALQPIRR